MIHVVGSKLPFFFKNKYKSEKITAIQRLNLIAGLLF